MSNKRLTQAQYQKILAQIAAQNGTTPENIKKEIQNAIDLAWENPKLGHKLAQMELLSHPNKPTPEELIAVMAADLREQKTR